MMVVVYVGAKYGVAVCAYKGPYRVHSAACVKAPFAGV